MNGQAWIFWAVTVAHFVLVTGLKLAFKNKKCEFEYILKVQWIFGSVMLIALSVYYALCLLGVLPIEYRYSYQAVLILMLLSWLAAYITAYVTRKK